MFQLRQRKIKKIWWAPKVAISIARLSMSEGEKQDPSDSHCGDENEGILIGFSPPSLNASCVKDEDTDADVRQISSKALDGLNS